MKTTPLKSAIVSGDRCICSRISAAVLILFAAVPRIGAETVAHWRFEEAASGEVPAHATVGGSVPNTLLDASGNGNHMQTWTKATAPAYSVQLAPPAGTLAGVAGTGAINTASLDFNGKPEDIYANSKPINSKQFQAWTVEASFQLDVAGSWQVILAKDGNPVGGQPPLTLKVRADNKLEIGVVDGLGTAKWVVGTTRIQAGVWYHAAATATSDTLSLWLKPTGANNFVAQGSISISGAFFNGYSAFNQPWIVGRGMWNGKQADWINGRIDEVRISDVALGSSQFLGNYSPNDSDSDDLPDTWELIYFREDAAESEAAILAKQSSLSADADGDSNTNFVELTYGLDPATANDLAGKLTQEIWFGIDGGTITDLTRNPRFYNRPDLLALNDGAVSPVDLDNSFGERLRGWITAPATGNYTFWISGDDQCELWLSTSASKFDKQLIANVSGWTAPQQWTKFPSQKSVTIPLVAGQNYFIEILHKDDVLTDSVAVAWTPPGGDLELLPAMVLAPYLFDHEDADRDELPDDWEAAHGFALTDDGLLRQEQHPLADPDHDGYNNLEESVFGMDPNTRGGVPGSLLLETWNKLDGATVEDLTFSSRFTDPPDKSEFVFSAETPVNRADKFGARMRGYIIAPATGNYTFQLSGDDFCQLWLSPSESQFAKQKIASVDGWTNVRQWTKYPAQTSAVVPLVAGQKYFIEALMKDAGGGDHLEIGWKTPGSTTTAVIPASALESYAFDVLDPDADNMPNDWEILHGLDRDRNDAAADPDQDGIPNHLEQAAGTDPQVKSTISGGLVQELWLGIPGMHVKELTGSAKFLQAPDFLTLVTSAQTVSQPYDAFGSRLRGYLTAPVTGTYTFWVQGDDETELWLSSSDSKFDKALLVRPMLNTANFDTDLSQRSRSVSLVAGQRYYLEILHKDYYGGDFCQIAWQKSGGTREIIPGSVLSSYTPTADDTDDDGLPDAWENANGLSTSDNGRINPQNGAHGDLDGDGLDNAAEFKAGTRADLADTDGDGVNDRDEVEMMETQALMADAAPFETVVAMDGNEFSANHGSWFADGNNGVQGTTRGWAEYDFNLSQDGVFQAAISLVHKTPGLSPGLLDLLIDVDGQPLGRFPVNVEANTTMETVKALTPWLRAGSHKLRVTIDNAVTWRRIGIRSVAISAARGPDVNSNGRPDWIDLRLAKNNSLEAPSESIVSPVCLEGKARWPGATTLNGAVVQTAPDDRWFANLALFPDQPTAVTASLENGGIEVARQVTWIPVNLWECGDLTIRQGDSLKLAAVKSSELASNEQSIFSFGGQSHSASFGNPLVYQFDAAGVVTVEVSDASSGTGRTVSIHVIACPVVESPICVVGFDREVEIPTLGDEVCLQMDRRIDIASTGPVSSGGKVHTLRLNTPENRISAFRLQGMAGPILGILPFRAMRVRSGSETSLTSLEATEEINRVAMPVMIDGLWSDAVVNIEIFIGGVTFDDGSLVRTIHPASDCDGFGVANVEFLKTGFSGSACHRVAVWQGAKRVAWKQ
jgi:hypothetical protein